MQSFFRCFLGILVVTQVLVSQNTVGLISIDPQNVTNGYNLLYPNNQSSVFLINNCGQLINTWEDERDGRPGVVAYLLENGDLLRASTHGNLPPSFGAGGSGGVIELLDWNGEIQWQYIIADTFKRQHHDVHMMPNGHVLAIVWENYDFEAIKSKGFDTIQNRQVELWCDAIYEIDPVLDSVIWIWRSWDHLVQEFDPNLENYGDISENPGKIDINYHDFSFGRQDWMHSNALDYNERLDQIILSVRNFNEFWIIDHSTSIEEAASDTGGMSGLGGQLIYRWGSPDTYGAGDSTDRKSFYQHDVQWIDDFVDPSDPNYGHIIFYNNMIADGLSLGHAIDPAWNDTTKRYEMNASGQYLPQSYALEFSHPDTSRNHSTAASSIQFLDNGHVVMCAGRQGRSFEIDEQGSVVWEYLTPLFFGMPVEQGTTIGLSHNFTFQIEKYPVDYPAFEGRDMSPKGYIELNPSSQECGIASNVHTMHIIPKPSSVFPNPVVYSLTIVNPHSFHNRYQIFSQEGRLISELDCPPGATKTVSMQNFKTGIYFLRESNGVVQKILILSH